MGLRPSSKISFFCVRYRLRSSAIDNLLAFYPSSCPEEYHSSFCSSFTFTEYFVAATNLSDSVVYPMLKHLSRFGLNLLFHIFNLSRFLNSFPSIWKSFLLFPSIRWENLSTHLLTSGQSFSPLNLKAV